MHSRVILLHSKSSKHTNETNRQATRVFLCPTSRRAIHGTRWYARLGNFRRRSGRYHRSGVLPVPNLPGSGMRRTFWSAVAGWLLTMLLSGTLLNSCLTNRDLRGEIRRQRSELLHQNVKIEMYETALQRYSEISDSLLTTGNENNRVIGNRLDSLAIEFGL